MKILVSFITMLLLATGCTGNKPIKEEQKIGSLPKVLNGAWNLKVKDLQNKVITTAIVSFSTEEAKSCIGGKWKKLIVKSHKSNGKNTFPITEHLSYELNKNKLTIGRNEICDGYLHLSGNLNGSKVIGKYYTFNIIGATNLGSFSLGKSLNK